MHNAGDCGKDAMNKDTDSETPDVLTGTPTYDQHEYCLDLFVRSIDELEYSNYSVLLVDNSNGGAYEKRIRERGLPVVGCKPAQSMRERMTCARKLLRSVTLIGGYDYLLFVDQDVLLPRDAINSLLRWNKPIMSGIYTKRAMGREWAFIKRRPWDVEEANCERARVAGAGVGSQISVTEISELAQQGLIQIHGCGYGCLLIATEVLHRVYCRYIPNMAALLSVSTRENARKLVRSPANLER